MEVINIEADLTALYNKILAVDKYARLGIVRDKAYALGSVGFIIDFCEKNSIKVSEALFDKWRFAQEKNEESYLQVWGYRRTGKEHIWKFAYSCDKLRGYNEYRDIYKVKYPNAVLPSILQIPKQCPAPPKIKRSP